MEGGWLDWQFAMWPVGQGSFQFINAGVALLVDTVMPVKPYAVQHPH